MPVYICTACNKPMLTFVEPNHVVPPLHMCPQCGILLIPNVVSGKYVAHKAEPIQQSIPLAVGTT